MANVMFEIAIQDKKKYHFSWVLFKLQIAV
jgi:hypothetical protein